MVFNFEFSGQRCNYAGQYYYVESERISANSLEEAIKKAEKSMIDHSDKSFRYITPPDSLLL
jgi:hypothetical protein